MVHCMAARTGTGYDADGATAALGTIASDVLARLPRFPYLDRTPPKSLDRNDFLRVLDAVSALSTEDGAAALTAARVRLRPILMTAFVLIASMLPLSMKLAPGGEAMIPLARAVIGGMLVSTVLTLFLVPCVYTLLKRTPVTA